MGYSLFIYDMSSFAGGAGAWLSAWESGSAPAVPLISAARLSGQTAQIRDSANAYLEDDLVRNYYQTLESGLIINGQSYRAGLSIQIGYRIQAADAMTGERIEMATILVQGQLVGVAVIDPQAGVSSAPTANLQPGRSYDFIRTEGRDTSLNRTLYDAYVTGPDPVTAPCFAAGTLIDTAQGVRRVETLRPGDLVLTRDRGPQPVRWVGARHLSAQDLARTPALRPIRIRAGALGRGQPGSDLVVSPQHRVLVCSRIAQRMFGAAEILVAARLLTTLEGIGTADDLEAITYVHFMCDRHEIVRSNGAATESLFAGPQALISVGAKARAEIYALFPELRDAGFVPPPARPMPPPKRLRKLAERHARNARALCEP